MIDTVYIRGKKMSFADELINYDKDSSWYYAVDKMVEMTTTTLREQCLKNRAVKQISGYVYPFWDFDSYSCKFYDKLPETEPQAIAKKMNEAILVRKKQKERDVFYGHYISYPYEEINFAQSGDKRENIWTQNLLNRYCEALREKIKKLGFTQFSVTEQNIDNIGIAINHSRFSGKVDAKRIQSKGEVTIVKVEIRW